MAWNCSIGHVCVRPTKAKQCKCKTNDEIIAKRCDNAKSFAKSTNELKHEPIIINITTIIIITTNIIIITINITITIRIGIRITITITITITTVVIVVVMPAWKDDMPNETEYTYDVIKSSTEKSLQMCSIEELKLRCAKSSQALANWEARAGLFGMRVDAQKKKETENLCQVARTTMVEKWLLDGLMAAESCFEVGVKEIQEAVRSFGPGKIKSSNLQRSLWYIASRVSQGGSL